jgi:hypothetical protein
MLSTMLHGTELRSSAGRAKVSPNSHLPHLTVSLAIPFLSTTCSLYGLLSTYPTLAMSLSGLQLVQLGETVLASGNSSLILLPNSPRHGMLLAVVRRNAVHRRIIIRLASQSTSTRLQDRAGETNLDRKQTCTISAQIMMGRQTTGNLVDGLGRLVACFGDRRFLCHLRGANFAKKRRKPPKNHPQLS